MTEPNQNPEPIEETLPEATSETAAQEVPVPEAVQEPAEKAGVQKVPGPDIQDAFASPETSPPAESASAEPAPAEPAPEPTAEPAPPVPTAPISDLPQKPKPTASQLRWGKIRFQLRRWLRKSLGLIVIACLIACAAYGAYLYRSTHEFKSLSTQKAQLAETAATEPVEATGQDSAVPTALDAAGSTEPQILPHLQELAERNPDFFGWLTIEGTRIDYPVMHTPEEPEKYLYANFDGEYRFSGTPFMDGNCYPDSDNYLIHAHNMLDGSMFRGLLEYEKESYWKEHPTIHFSTLYEEGEYEILAVFRDRVYFETEDCFKFYKFIDAADEADFDNAIAQFKEKALYDTGITASYGDQLITLATCAYHVEDGRFVVVARKTK